MIHVESSSKSNLHEKTTHMFDLAQDSTWIMTPHSQLYIWRHRRFCDHYIKPCCVRLPIPRYGRSGRERETLIFMVKPRLVCVIKMISHPPAPPLANRPDRVARGEQGGPPSLGKKWRNRVLNWDTRIIRYKGQPIRDIVYLSEKLRDMTLWKLVFLDEIRDSWKHDEATSEMQGHLFL